MVSKALQLLDTWIAQADEVLAEQSKKPEITPITPDTSGGSTAHYLAHRLHLVFNELGLLPHVPSDWLQPSPDGLGFRPLSVREADKLVLALENLVDGYESPRANVSPDQLTFDLSDE